MGEVLAHAAAQPEHFGQRRVDGRGSGVELEVAVDARRKIADGTRRSGRPGGKLGAA